ncbi:MAG: VCBS repeat-containing protein [Planctomycetota bacterium]
MRATALLTFLSLAPLLSTAAAQCPAEVLLEELESGAPGPTLATPRGAPILDSPFALQVTDGPAFASGVLGLGTVEAPLFLPTYGATLFPQVTALVPLVLDAAGATPQLLPTAAMSPALCGLPLIAQAALVDASAAGGVALTNGLRMVAGSVQRPVLPSVAVPVGLGVEDVLAADVDGDGREDLVTANGKGNDLGVLLGQGAGAFAPQPSVPLADHPLALAGGDLDGDGDFDLVAATQGLPFFVAGSTFSVLGGGDGTFAAPQLIELGARPTDITTADFDGDGVLDVAVTDEELGDVAVHLGTGGGAFAPSTQYLLAGEGWAVATADFDADGSLDLALSVDAFAATDFLTVLAGTGTGAFLPSQFLFGPDGPRSLASADLDANGTADLVVTDDALQPALSFLGAGDGTFAAPLAIDAGRYARGLLLEDLDADGTLDLAVTSAFFDDARVLAGVGDGTFGEARIFGTAYDPVALAPGDFDGDGVADLAVACRGEDRVELLLGAVSDVPAARLPVDDGPGVDVTFDFALEDFDGDGELDLVGGGQLWELFTTYGVVGVLTGDGQGGFSTATGTPTGANGFEAIALGDLDGDGWKDVVSANGAGATISLLRGSSAGLMPGTPLSAGEPPVDVALADFDGDGDLDAVLPNGFVDSATVLLGDGAGGFAAPVSYATETRPWTVATADLDLDGDADFVLGSLLGQQLSTFRGAGDGTFGSYQATSVSGGVWELAVGELSGDGVPDVAVARTSSTLPSVGVLLGAGDGSVLPVVDLGEPLATRSVAIADVTGDGVPDVLAGNQASEDVTVFAGVGNGVFEQAGSFGAGRHLEVVAAGDVDGDGLTDVAAVNRYTGFSLLLNRIGEQP